MNKTILLADDNENDAFLTRFAFEQVNTDYELQEVRDGRDVMNYLEGAGKYKDRELYPSPALIIMDVRMPIISGLAALFAIKKNPKYRRLPVILLSASDYPDDIRQAFDFGATAYMSKPSAIEECVALFQAIFQWMKFNLLMTLA